MSTLPTPQLSFPHVFRCKSVSSRRRRFLACELCNRDYMKLLPQPCVQNDALEPEALDEDLPVLENSKIEESIDYVKQMLGSMDDGRISVSAYDTAWIALIRDLQGRDIPQFPSSLDWISNNQLSDGSWGDEQFFLAYDRLLNTLACVVALTTWKIHADMIQKGLSFIKENVCKLEESNAEHMTCGFEVVFPALLQRARDLGILGIPYDAPVIRQICVVRDRKMERAPIELMHNVPTCLLYNLEGLENLELEWPKLLKLQTPKGTFLTSPAATSFAVMETKDENCITFINYVVNKFNGGAPTVYPVDIFARLWAVDRLQRLGISRFFAPEIKNCLDHVYRFWTEKGSFSARESEFCDIDCTSMGFRLLRLHGYNISPNALSNFKKDDEFTCYVGQGFESPSPIINLYRASQVLFPGETILEQARQFSYNFLRERLRKNQLLDKWLISKHLPDEIKCGVEMPWYATLPRVETRFYVQNYGVDDIWIGKSLYRMPEINNEAYLELAKLDYNKCQAQHQMEWNRMEQWYEDSGLEEFGISKKELLLYYFLASASIFEPERSGERSAWVKSQTVCTLLSSCYFSKEEAESSEQSIEFGNGQPRNWGHGCKYVKGLITILFETLRDLKSHAQERTGRDISNLLLDAWGVWLNKQRRGDDEIQAAELLVSTINICSGYIVSEETLFKNEYNTLSDLTNKICCRLRQLEKENVSGMEWNKERNCFSKYVEIEKDMQLLVKLVLQESSNGISKDIKQTFLMVAKTFYYRAYFATEQIDKHVSKVLFHPVL
ncbi:copal-8-ol diphosphate hydratase, chloroplastic-like isoform X2 [Sesamum indicum]|uniref:Copal-8-ol diphosphate hydratase, chloroplastic-like isoform X2 n=1 Tax=Sesamum indicum TaxID=4182 RepID=A0A6I9TGH7_SESIN|nr:copal-8-ol diphosphate hydratase, chloroplastic-like isoform X2 [Sesamum indicum]